MKLSLLGIYPGVDMVFSLDYVCQKFSSLTSIDIRTEEATFPDLPAMVCQDFSLLTELRHLNLKFKGQKNPLKNALRECPKLEDVFIDFDKQERRDYTIPSNVKRVTIYGDEI